jgi:hypothetical protein
MYTMGDRFGFGGLEEDGGSQIRGCNNADGGCLDLLPLVTEVYELTLEHDRGATGYGCSDDKPGTLRY